ncbi:hypothetical protein [Mycoplasmoides gallisepticum]|nr:hypothetical protein [Mycoplasmoides gallisepticum]WGG23910.1 hypothetical protein P0D30_03900 [Mycoplasmoides gallisepticum]
MLITKIISVAAITVPISMNLNNKIKTTLKNKRNIYKNIDLINNSSLVDQEASVVLDSKNNDHATKVAAIISKKHGVNTYHSLYDLRFDTSTNSSNLYSGLEDRNSLYKKNEGF